MYGSVCEKVSEKVRMADVVAKGTWVEIWQIALTPDQRAPQVPADTRRVPLEMRVKGFLAAPARVGEQVEIVTSAGRCLRGVLGEVNPAYSHGFGPPVPELSAIGSEVRTILRERGRFK
jgi:hypothetical protein